MPAKHNPGDIKARKKWNAENMTTLACGVRKETAEQFRETCRRNGTTAHAVIKEFVLDYIAKNPGPGTGDDSF